MTPEFVFKKMTCSCLMQMGNLEIEVIARLMQNAQPDADLLVLTDDEFKALYLQVTNTMFRDHVGYANLTQAGQASIDARLADRCGHCGMAVRKHLKKHREAASHASALCAA